MMSINQSVSQSVNQ